MIAARRRWLRAAFYLGPVALWLAVLYLLGTRYGSFTASFTLYKSVTSSLVAPYRVPEDDTFLMAQAVQFRRAATLLCYGVLTLLLLRALQWGSPRLRWYTVAAVVPVTASAALLDTLHKDDVPGRHGGLGDVLLDMAGVALFLGGALLFFAVKSVERRLSSGDSGGEADVGDLQVPALVPELQGDLGLAGGEGARGGER
jgi:prolipoprotein diacylglyceryltransferase